METLRSKTRARWGHRRERSEGVYQDHLSGGVSPADTWHDPLTYIQIAVLGGGFYKAAPIALSQLATNNPQNNYVSIGSYDENGLKGYIEVGNGQNMFGQNMTYFNLGKSWGILNFLGLTDKANEMFMNNLIAQGKSFFVTLIGDIGRGTTIEKGIIENSKLYFEYIPKFMNFASIYMRNNYK
jgi:hypothetical protein